MTVDDAQGQAPGQGQTIGEGQDAKPEEGTKEAAPNQGESQKQESQGEGQKSEETKVEGQDGDQPASSSPVDGENPATRGDEDEIESVEHKDEVPKIPDDFFYKYEEHVSQARVSEDSGLPSDLLTLQYPFLEPFDLTCGSWGQALLMDLGLA